MANKIDSEYSEKNHLRQAKKSSWIEILENVEDVEVEKNSLGRRSLGKVLQFVGMSLVGFALVLFAFGSISLGTILIGLIGAAMHYWGGNVVPESVGISSGGAIFGGVFGVLALIVAVALSIWGIFMGHLLDFFN